MNLEKGLKPELLAVADELGMNLNDTAVAALADHYGVTVEPTGLPPRARSKSAYVCWSMPVNLRDKIADDLTKQNRRRRRAGEEKLTQADLVNGILRDYVTRIAA